MVPISPSSSLLWFVETLVDGQILLPGTEVIVSALEVPGKDGANQALLSALHQFDLRKGMQARKPVHASTERYLPTSLRAMFDIFGVRRPHWRIFARISFHANGE